MLGVVFLVAGAMHFVAPRAYEAIMPDYLPAQRALVLLSGVAEMAGGAGVLVRRTARPAGWWLVLVLLAVFPANVNMTVNAERFPDVPEALLWVRLPLQGLLGWWVWRVAVAPRRP